MFLIVLFVLSDSHSLNTCDESLSLQFVLQSLTLSWPSVLDPRLHIQQIERLFASWNLLPGERKYTNSIELHQYSITTYPSKSSAYVILWHAIGFRSPHCN